MATEEETCRSRNTSTKCFKKKDQYSCGCVMIIIMYFIIKQMLLSFKHLSLNDLIKCVTDIQELAIVDNNASVLKLRYSCGRREIEWKNILMLRKLAFYFTLTDH